MLQHLLDQLAEAHRGASDYVRPEENIEAKVSRFYDRISLPLLTDLRLRIEGVETYEVYPAELPDLFAGDQIVVTGRYKGSGRGAMVLEAMSRQQRERIRHAVDFPERAESMDFIPRLWAVRKIGYLLDEVRLHRNQEVIDEIVRLAKEYGVVTEFTSFLIEEDMILAQAGDRRMLSRAQGLVFGMAQPPSGAAAVDTSVQAQTLQRRGFGGAAAPLPGIVAGRGGQSQESLGLAYTPSGVSERAQQVVRNIGTRTFYQQSKQWVDSRYQKGQRVITVQAFSEAHFALLRKRPDLRQYLSLGEDVLVQLERVAVQIAPQGKSSLSEEEWRLIGTQS
ncbi:MAG: hypothetical protein NZ749_00165 [bacterium]|nr:hypothetical protein [bacterium]